MACDACGGCFPGRMALKTIFNFRNVLNGRPIHCKERLRRVFVDQHLIHRNFRMALEASSLEDVRAMIKFRPVQHALIGIDS